MSNIYDERPIGDIYVEWANTLDSVGQNSLPARSRLCTPDVLARVYMMMEAVKSAGMLADHVKKYVFYDKEGVIDQVPDTMPVPFVKLRHAKESFDDHDTIRIFHGILGLVTEAAEMMEMLQAHIFEFAALDMQNLLEECGDQTWYLALLAKSLDLATFNEFFATNKAKLTLRYGDKWNQDGALNRDTAAEMQAIDSTRAEGNWAIPSVESTLAQMQEVSNCVRNNNPLFVPRQPISETGTCPECLHGWHCDPDVHCEDPTCECKFTTLKNKRDDNHE